MTFPSSASGPFRDLERGKISGAEYARKMRREADRIVRQSSPGRRDRPTEAPDKPDKPDES